MMGFLQLFNAVVYVKLRPDLLTVREVNSGYELREPPLIAISRKPKERILAVGQEAVGIAAAEGAELVNPFNHPRSLLSDFVVAEHVMKHFVQKAGKAGRGWLFRPSPVVVLHPVVDPEGGFTQIEIRAMQELVLGAGARKAINMARPRTLERGAVESAIRAGRKSAELKLMSPNIHIQR